jgi:hypothetical protein
MSKLTSQTAFVHLFEAVNKARPSDLDDEEFAVAAQTLLALSLARMPATERAGFFEALPGHAASLATIIGRGQPPSAWPSVTQ